QTAYIGETVHFNGSGSFDPDVHWENEIVDWGEGGVGRQNSLALDTNGDPHISYQDCHNTSLKYARKRGDSWDIETLDSEGSNGWHSSIALDGNDKPHISYNKGRSDEALKYAKWTGSNWRIEIVDSSGDRSNPTSLALDSSGKSHISYYESQDADLKYAKSSHTGWIIQTVDSTDYVGHYSSISLDTSDMPHISYYDWTNGDLKYAKWIGDSWNIKIVDSESNVGVYNSLALDRLSNPHISYLDLGNHLLKYAFYNGSAWHIETVTSLGYTNLVGHVTSLALDSYDYPHISYFQSQQRDLRYAVWTGAYWNIETVDSEGHAGSYSSLAVDEDDNPRISYIGDAALKYANRIGGITSYEWDFGDGSPHGFGICPIHVYDSTGIYNVTLTVTNSEGKSDTDICVITINFPPSASPSLPNFQLNQGWNLISLPTIQNNTGIQTVLQSIEWEYDVLQLYDASDSRDPWKHYHVSKPSHLNDLSEINHEMGIWIHIVKEEGTTLYLEGDKSTTPQFINLYSGWNLVGYPSTTNRLRNNALNNLMFGTDVDLIQTYNSETQNWEEIRENDCLEIGKGYWVHAKTDCVWEVLN
ncbi:MAG: PKD domain-containing protein, partial [Thermoplasmata archaeon]